MWGQFPCERVRPLVVLALLSVATFAVALPPASADDGDAPAGASSSSQAADCGYETTRIEPIPNDPLIHLYADVTTRDCPEGRSWDIAIQDPEGRTDIQWYDDERGRGLEIFRPPRFVSWLDSDRGCQMVIYVFGANELECVLGAPPTPPAPPS